MKHKEEGSFRSFRDCSFPEILIHTPTPKGVPLSLKNNLRSSAEGVPLSLDGCKTQ
jgi:hypothetical protein